MNKKPIVYVSTCAIIDSNDRILITSRENRNDFSNCWEFPGGKIEENETPEECLIRELKEEINVDVSKKCIAPIGFSSHEYKNFHIVLMLYITRKWEGKFQANEKNIFKWVSYSELKKHKMPEANSNFFPIIFELI